jgi:hypothetical protein
MSQKGSPKSCELFSKDNREKNAIHCKLSTYFSKAAPAAKASGPKLELPVGT